MRPAAAGNFFARRWRGEIPWGTLLWRDMLGVGTVINLAASVAALMSAAQGVDIATAVALHFAPVPYNVFLAAALWRLPQRPMLASLAALAWLVVMTVI